ncbi:MAG: serine/threonine protein kinase [Kofleriaceae bacterium]
MNTRLLILVPVLVIGAGIVVLLLGRSATIEASDNLARKQLAAQASDVQRDVALALDQAGPMLDRLRAMADPRLPVAEVGPRMVELVVGRIGVASAHIAFPSGIARSTVKSAQGDLRFEETTQPLAAPAKVRSWTPPRDGMITAIEPILGLDGEVVAAVSVDFEVAALSPFVQRSPLAGARTAVIARDGTILYGDPGFRVVIDALGGRMPAQLEFLEVTANDGAYLASVTPVGGSRGGIEAPLDWYLAALVPESTLLAPTKSLLATSLVASGVALVLALGIALLLAWNVMRMRRDVVEAKARVESANQQLRQLGAYRLIEKLGSGGMGEVWRAQHRLLQREAAVKLVREEAIADEEGRKKALSRFKREAQTLAQMKSRHTIALYDYGVSDDGCFYYVMELLHGVDLDKLVRESGAVPAARVIKILIAACQSLGEAHEAGLLHRDIKPANIFLSRAADEVDVVKVLDFGIVHAIDAPPDEGRGSQQRIPQTKLTREGALVGTPGFMAPEAMRGEKLDGRSDLYALGCVAWWLLARGEVFPRPDGKAAMRNHMYLPVPDLRMQVHGWLPAQLEAIVISMLAKHPEDRPASARVLADMLRAIDIPDEHAWTDERAHQWWASYRPALPVSDADANTIAEVARGAPSETKTVV